MDTRQRDQILGSIIPDSAWRTAAVPTFRAGRALFMTGVALSDAGAEGDHEPDLWYAVDRESGEFAGLGDPTLWGVVPADWRTVGARHRDAVLPGSLTAREAARLLRSNWVETIDAFHSGLDLDADRRHRIDQAVRTLTPPGLATWIFACCDDFWTWLRAGT